MKAYAIKDPKGEIMPNSTSDTMDGSIGRLILFYGTQFKSWQSYFDEGYRCVPVLITEVKTDK